MTAIIIIAAMTTTADIVAATITFKLTTRGDKEEEGTGLVGSVIATVLEGAGVGSSSAVAGEKISHFGATLSLVSDDLLQGGSIEYGQVVSSACVSHCIH